MSDLADRLLDAHVAYEIEVLRTRFAELAETEIDHALATFGSLTLSQVMERRLVQEVATKYVALFRLPGAIPEIAGEIARRVRAHEVNAMPLGEIVGRDRVEELVTVLSELRTLRERVLRGVATSPGVGAGVGGMVHEAATGAVVRGRRLVEKLPGASLGLGITDRIAGGLVGDVDQRTRVLAEQGAQLLLGYLGDGAARTVSDEDLRVAILDVWDELAKRPIGELFAAVSDEQLVEVFAALYDLWLDLRTSGYLTALVDSGIEYVFDTYGDFRLDELLAEFGLGREDLVEEALRFGPPVIEALHEAGLLEELVRPRLAGFYASPAARALLES